MAELTDAERIEKLERQVAGLLDHARPLLNTPQKLLYSAVNGLFARAFGMRRQTAEFGVKALNQIPFDGEDPDYIFSVDFQRALSDNAYRLERALRSGPVELPEGVVPVNRAIKTYNRNVNITGFGAKSSIRVYPRTDGQLIGQGLDLNISDGKHKVILRNFKVEMAADFDQGEHICITCFGGDLNSEEDFVLSDQNLIIENVSFAGSNAYTSERPWSHGTQYGLKLYNPNYARISWLQMQGHGYRKTDNSFRSTYGIYIESVRGGYACHIESPKLHDVQTAIEVRNPIPSPGNYPYGQEGLKITYGELVSCYDGIRLIGDTYGAPGWHIEGNHIACQQFGLYVEQMRQGYFCRNILYCTGHNDAGIAAYVYLNLSASNWQVKDNTGLWQGSPETTKSPYGAIISGGYISVLDRVESAVANDFSGNYWVGKPGGNKEEFWFQDAAVNNRYLPFRAEFYKPGIQNIPQNDLGDNSRKPPAAGGAVPIVHGEQSVREITEDVDGNPLDPPQYVVLPRTSEGPELFVFQGDITVSRVSSQGEIVPIDLEAAEEEAGVPIQDPDGYIADVQFSRSELIEIRETYISSINTTDPDHPLEVTSPFADRNIRGFAARHGQRIRLETKVDILLKYNVDLLPLRDKKDLILKPGDWIEFHNTKNGIEEISRFASPQLTDTLDGLSGLMQYVLDDTSGSPHVWPDPTGYHTYHVYSRPYTSPSDNLFEDQWAVNFKNGTVLHRVKHDTGVSSWTQLSGPSRYTNTADGLLSDVPYQLEATIEGKSLWHLRQTEYVGTDGTSRYCQFAFEDDATMAIVRSRVGSGAWTKWQKIGSRLVDGMSQITNRDFGVYIDSNNNLQVGAKSTEGVEYLLRRLPAIVDESAITGGSYLEFRDTTNDRTYLLTMDDLITVIRRVTDSLYLSKTVTNVGTFNGTTDIPVRYRNTTGQIVRNG